eukprot:NODE_414_length_7911_cov_0.926011.p9 type:complete len:115 gc:universal NODE_414_length_7911_cov_0.926011:3237-3581(+)
MDFTDFDYIKQTILYCLVAALVLTTICTCGICGYMRTHEHIEAGNIRKQRSQEELLSDDKQSNISPSEQSYESSPGRIYSPQVQKSYLRESNDFSSPKAYSEGGDSLRDKYYKQ